MGGSWLGLSRDDKKRAEGVTWINGWIMVALAIVHFALNARMWIAKLKHLVSKLKG